MLKVSNLTKKIKKKLILDNISFLIKEGDILGLVGNNGAGKTTIIKSIFKENLYESGEIEFNNQKIDKTSLREIAFFPDSNNIPLELTLLDYIIYSSIAIGIEKKVIKARLTEVFDLLKLHEFKNTKLKHLSAGWKKSAIMASILVRKPKLIIFDEPTANVDVETKKIFMDIFSFLVKKGITIMITSHIIAELQSLINHLVIIDKGRILYDNEFDCDNESILKIYNDILKNENEEDKEIELKFYSNE